jgi:predicted  nucleic acid-binding Zn-ribbon protein
MEVAMTNDIENIILGHLRAMRADISALKGDVRDIKGRLASIETYIATMHGDQARTSTALDDLAERVERLEQRTGIIEA